MIDIKGIFRCIIPAALSVFCLLIAAHYSFSQIVVAEVPYFSRGSGTGISSNDSLFLLNIRFRIQNRIDYTSNAKTNYDIPELGARVERMRLRLDGFFYKTNLVYVVQLGFSKSDITPYDSDYPSILKDAVIFYRFNKNFTLGLGLTNLPRNRQSVMSSGDLEFVDRSILHSIFFLGRNYGLQAYYYNNIKEVYFALRSSITTSEGGDVINNQRGFSYTGRAEILPLGKFAKSGDYFEGDLEREEKPKLSIGVTYNYSQNITRTGIQTEKFLFRPRDMTTIMTDWIGKFEGFSLAFEYIYRTFSDNPVTENSDGEISFIFEGQGQNYQLGYLFRNNIEVAFRYSNSLPSKRVSTEINRIEEFTLGISKYIKGHRLKIQSDFTYSTENIYYSPLDGDYLKARLQFELGI